MPYTPYVYIRTDKTRYRLGARECSMIIHVHYILTSFIIQN
jgi:hypothetical protein